MFSLYQPNILIKMLIPALYRGDKKKRDIYLTFDDGPSPETTLHILDILRQADVKATFFIVGNNAVEHPDLFQAIINDRHKIGNHTMRHENGFHTTTKRYISSVETCQQNLPACDTPLFRPPHGRLRPCANFLLRRKGYKVIAWDVIAYDWDKQKSPEEVLNIIKTHVRNGSIICLHDSSKASGRTPGILHPLISWLKENGFSFKTL